MTRPEKRLAAAKGYASRRYAESLGEFGEPRLLPRSEGWLLEREIPGSHDRDAMGCYPLFDCGDFSALADDLRDLEDELVSVALVPDPFADYTPADLESAFGDVCRPFKQHFVLDLDMAPEKAVAPRHRYRARRALKNARVEVCDAPLDHLDEWVALYDHLIERHGVSGIRAFSREAFARQLAMPGMVLLRALAGGEVVGGQLWLESGSAVTHHLSAFSPAGYRLAVSYAVNWEAIRHFRRPRAAGSGRARWLNFGGGAGLRDDPADGLARFKKGWSSGIRTATFCGRILDPERYRELTAAAGTSGGDFFPAYRARA